MCRVNVKQLPLLHAAQHVYVCAEGQGVLHGSMAGKLGGQQCVREEEREVGGANAGKHLQCQSIVMAAGAAASACLMQASNQS